MLGFLGRGDERCWLRWSQRPSWGELRYLGVLGCGLILGLLDWFQLDDLDSGTKVRVVGVKLDATYVARTQLDQILVVEIVVRALKQLLICTSLSVGSCRLEDAVRTA